MDPQTKAVLQQSMRNASSGFNGWNFTKLYLWFFSWGSNSAASACPSWLVNGILQHRNLLNNTDAMQCDAINAASSTLQSVSWFNNDTGYKTRVPTTCSLKMLQALRAESQYSMLPLSAASLQAPCNLCPGLTMTPDTKPESLLLVA